MMRKKSEVHQTHSGSNDIISKRFNWQNLFDEENKVNSELKSLGLKLEILQNIMMEVNTLHHNIRKSSKSISNTAIDSQNIKIFIEKSTTKKIKIHINLFGSKSANRAKQEFNIRKHFQADIHELVPIAIALLGGQPFTTKALYTDSTARSKAHYSFDFMLEDHINELRDISFSINGLLMLFLNRMQSSPAPDCDEILTFFTALNYSYKIAKSGFQDAQFQDRLNANRLIMILLANGQWDTKFNVIKLGDCNEIVNPMLSLYTSAPRNFTNDYVQSMLEKIEVSEIKQENVRLGDALLNDWIICENENSTSSRERTCSFKLIPSSEAGKDQEVIESSDEEYEEKSASDYSGEERENEPSSSDNVQHELFFPATPRHSPLFFNANASGTLEINSKLNTDVEISATDEFKNNSVTSEI